MARSVHEVVLVGGVRTPVGKLGGGLATVRPDDLLALVLRELAKRVGFDPAEVGEVYTGCANQAGEDNRNVARMATLLAGYPHTVPAVTLNRLCASGLEAVVQAARAVALGDVELAVAGGVESMSRAPWVIGKPDKAFPTGAPAAFDTSLGWRFENPAMKELFPLESMGETAENLAEKYRIPREEQDRFAFASHQKAVAAQGEGKFEDELVPVPVKQGKTTVTVGRDEGPRADSSLEKLATLKAAFRPGGTVTAGNSSTLNDGAAAVVVCSAGYAARKGLAPLGRLVASASAGVEPRTMGIGPVPATRIALARAGWKESEVDLVELNEAFAAQALAVLQELPGLDPAKVNVNGGAIALGHPLGMSGARLVVSLLRELRRRKAKRGLATLCVGVGQGATVCLEAP